MKRVISRHLDFSTISLLLLTLLASATRPVATGWSDGLGVTLTLTLLGTALGLALGISRFQRTGVAWLSFGYSLIIIPLVLGIAQYPGIDWQERLANLGGRLSASFGLFFAAKPVEDALLFITAAAALYWILGLYAGFALARKASFLAAILPTGVFLFLVQLYDNWNRARIGWLAIYLFASLLLLGRLDYDAKRGRWAEQRVWYSSASVTDLTTGLTITTLIILLLAWITPTSVQPLTAIKSTWEQVTRPLQQVCENLANAVAGLEENAAPSTADIYGSALPLGRSSATGDAILFTSKEGFCNYYASAEVVMLHSLGIPAQLAVGYSDGERQSADRRIVRQRNAHAWPEVYFPGIGWVEFEPTSSELPLVRLTGGPEIASAGGNDHSMPGPQAGGGPSAGEGSGTLPGGGTGEGSGAQFETFPQRITGVLFVLAAAAAIGFLVIFEWDEKLRRRLAAFTQTPVPVHLKAVLTALLLGSASKIRTLLDEYQRGLFGRRSGNAHTARRAAERLWTAVLIAALKSRFAPLRRTFGKGKT